ncbi:proline racemase family protein [Natrialba taiwanensis]|uniref:Proline racemase n=1 Tax=Natrialba taiwanensis DSM 12281 TaxID=1230458 RepID=M0AD36_9EURY|nr:proline racemase family protein [Natrialba taiwanensis]ELY96444.1 proline racemase [Natrialba taiwanensis DSM 12281]
MTSDNDFDDTHVDASFTTIDTHTAGEPTRILLDGLDRSTLDGESVRAKRKSFAEEYDWVRKLLMKEPRGHDDMFGAVIVDPCDDTADLGVFFMDSKGYLDMCGHGTIGVVSALIEHGHLSAEPTIHVETPAGVVEATPQYAEGGVERVTIQNVTSFVYDAATVPVSFLDSPLRVDIVYAGNFFALVDSEQLGVSVDTTRTDDFVNWGLEIRDAVNDELDIVHPFSGEPDSVSITEIYESSDDADRSIVIFGGGQVDRSPCGTGTCAKMTLLYESGRLAVDEPYIHESVIGTRFEGRIIETKEREGITLTVPTVTGTARITGKHTFIKDHRDSITSLSIASDEE